MITIIIPGWAFLLVIFLIIINAVLSSMALYYRRAIYKIEERRKK